MKSLLRFFLGQSANLLGYVTLSGTLLEQTRNKVFDLILFLNEPCTLTSVLPNLMNVMENFKVTIPITGYSALRTLGGFRYFRQPAFTRNHNSGVKNRGI